MLKQRKPVYVDDEVLDGRQRVLLDELPVRTDGGVDLLLNVLLEIQYRPHTELKTPPSR